MIKLNEHQKRYLEPKFQNGVIRSLRAHSERELRVLGYDGDYPEEILAAWIYQHALEPLGL